MCTAVSYRTRSHYFGRNLDIERGYNERIVITPRKFPMEFRHVRALEQHYALIGMATVVNGYPLYFEATNEKGLSMAGLNFPKNAFYQDYVEGKMNVAPFELIPYVLGKCASVDEVKGRLHQINVIHCNFSEDLPVSPLHWIISDREGSIVLECTRTGMKAYDNPYGVLTNNPTFDYHLMNLNQYMGLSERLGENRLIPAVSMDNFSLGFGGFGLPGDFSSPSRFVRAVFVKEKSVCDGSEKESVNQFFRILQSVAMPKGCVMTESGEYEYTRYSCCCNTDTRTYYYTTYQDMTIKNVELCEADLDGIDLVQFQL